ncbi:MAG: trypsin-like peptidase domain-containing protein [Lachnospiraceae bacterium]|nr:trypsin-like peptidase domain-containing protein [Lachnospiraceae bacterium]
MKKGMQGLLLVLLLTIIFTGCNSNERSEESISESVKPSEEATTSEDKMLTVFGEIDREELLEKLKSSVIRIEADARDESGAVITLGGSGVIIDITDSYIDIVTASHVVEQTAKPLVYFYGGGIAYGSVLAYGKYSDVAFIRVEVDDASESVMEVIGEAHIADNEAYSALVTGESVYMLGSSARVAEDVVQGTVKEMYVFVALFQNEMLVCCGAVTDGMSGGGTFDAQGNLIGVLVGTNDVDAVSVAITDVLSEYRSISQ